MKLFYKPAYISLAVDILTLILSSYVVLDWFPLTTQTPFNKYSWPSFFFMLIWLICSYLLKRYLPLRRERYFKATFKLFYTSLIVFGFFWALIFFFFNGFFSEFVLFSITISAFSLEYVFLFLFFAYRYAVQYDGPISQKEERPKTLVKPASRLDESSYNDLCITISKYSGVQVLTFLSNTIDLESGNTLVSVTSDTINLKLRPNFLFSTIVNLEILNNSNGINSMFSVINEKLPDDGLFICCYESKSTRKKRILKRYFKGLNYFFYTIDFFIKRILPKIFITRRLYFDLTHGKNRILSKAEVLGRLYSCGFEVLKEKKIGQLTYVYAQRVKQPICIKNPSYGPLIRLRRFGEDGKPFNVYKMRTMHPYSEYLQAYIYLRNNLKDGGKFNKDIRITTIGKLMRKYWLDELPMVINLLKRNMKLVGVRPLSEHYFSLYSKELQEKRIKFKPGLFPPFYADLPRTLDEIQASEMRYLMACETNGVFITDFHYFFRIMKNILIKKVRSA